MAKINKNKYNHYWIKRGTNVAPFKCKKCGALSGTNSALSECPIASVDGGVMASEDSTDNLYTHEIIVGGEKFNFYFTLTPDDYLLGSDEYCLNCKVVGPSFLVKDNIIEFSRVVLININKSIIEIKQKIHDFVDNLKKNLQCYMGFEGDKQASLEHDLKTHVLPDIMFNIFGKMENK